MASTIPAGYRAQRVWRELLSGGGVPDVIVSSVGPSDVSLGWLSANVQVLSWDPIAGRWNVAFDAQRAIPQAASYEPGNSNRSPGGRWGDIEPSGAGTLIDPDAYVSLGEIRFAERSQAPASS